MSISQKNIFIVPVGRLLDVGLEMGKPAPCKGVDNDHHPPSTLNSKRFADRIRRIIIY